MNKFINLLILFASCHGQCDIHNNFMFGSLNNNNEKLNNIPIISILNQYIAEHGVHKLANESTEDLCSRKFMYWT